MCAAIAVVPRPTPGRRVRPNDAPSSGPPGAPSRSTSDGWAHSARAPPGRLTPVSLPHACSGSPTFSRTSAPTSHEGSAGCRAWLKGLASSPNATYSRPLLSGDRKGRGPSRSSAPRSS
ncbi:MAG TPA: hypothetical protein VFS43_18185 [Polyangiaceae bacterium]|nr:hypothetical protein [Polyangiaceae bacterium]